MSDPSGTATDDFVLMNVYDEIDPPAFEPRNISTSNGKAVRFFLDYSSGTMRASSDSRIIESAGPESPCTELKDGWKIAISSDDWMARYVEMSLGNNYEQRARYFFGQLRPGETSECLNGLWGALDVSESELEAYKAAVALAKNSASSTPGSTGTILSPTRKTTKPNPSPTSTNTGDSNRTRVQTLTPTIAIVVAVVGLFVVCLLVCLWQRRRGRRRTAALDNAMPDMSEASVSRGDVIHRDENDRLVMRAGSISTLPLYSPARTSSALPDTASSPPPNPFMDPSDPFADTTGDDDDDVPLMALVDSRRSTASSATARRPSNRRRNAEVVSPTRTMHSDMGTLPEYRSIGGSSRPPSFVSRGG